MHKGRSLVFTPEMDEVISKAQGVRQGAIVTPLLFESSISGDAERVYCTMEEGDNINPVVGLCNAKL